MASSIKTTPKSEPTPKTKSLSRLALIANNQDLGSESDHNYHHQIPHFSVEYAPSPSPTKRRKTPSRLAINKPKNFPLHDHLLLSPSPVRKSRTRLSDRLDMVDDQSEHRRRCKTRTSSNGLLSCFSPRNLRRSRRRIDTEDGDFVAVDEMVKPKRRRNSSKPKKEKLTSSLTTLPRSKAKHGEENAVDRLGQMIWELVMWRDVAKSSLWFGFGCLCFLSSCFTKGLSISLFSVFSHLGLLFLAASFMANSLHPREKIPSMQEVSLKEDDILRAIRVLMPALNLVISKTRQLFSGEPSMTLKVALFLLAGAEYGHLLTLWRLCALGFFTSFTAPKLYSSYSAQINSKVDQFKSRISEAWRSCYHKKIIIGSAVTIFWNPSSIKTRVIAAFISLVILRYYRQLSETNTQEESTPTEDVQSQGQAAPVEDVQPQGQTATEEPEKEPENALVIANSKSDKK